MFPDGAFLATIPFMGRSFNIFDFPTAKKLLAHCRRVYKNADHDRLRAKAEVTYKEYYDTFSYRFEEIGWPKDQESRRTL